MKKEVIHVPGVEPRKHLSRVVKHGNTLYLAGCSGRPLLGGERAADMTGQARTAMENIKMLLEGAGSSMENVLRMTVYLANMKDKAAFDAVFIPYFPKDPPARACFAVGDLGEGTLLEIETTACIPD